jgi:hypothetical protein
MQTAQQQWNRLRASRPRTQGEKHCQGAVAVRVGQLLSEKLTPLFLTCPEVFCHLQVIAVGVRVPFGRGREEALHQLC